MSKKKTVDEVEMPGDVPDEKNDYEARNAFEDIMRAHKHMQNPGLMKRVQKHSQMADMAHRSAMKTVMKGIVKAKPRSTDDLRKLRSQRNTMNIKDVDME